MKIFFKMLVTRKISLCPGWAFEVVSESLDISTNIDFYWWMNKLFDYMWTVTLLGMIRQKQVKNWCCFRNHVGSQICFWNNTLHFWLSLHFFCLFLFVCFFCFFFLFSWIFYLKRIKANLEKYVRYLYLKFLNYLFLSKSFYDSIDFVQLDG